MKKLLIIIGLLALFIVLFRGNIYRFFVQYDDIGERQKIKITNLKLIEKIEKKSSGKTMNLAEITKIADEITTEELSFSTEKTPNNPNKLIRSHQANCIGYSTMFNAVSNYLIQKNQLENEIKATHKIGHLYVLGINIHLYFENPFFKNHDFNEIVNKKTKEKRIIDPTISDYLWINNINQKK